MCVYGEYEYSSTRVHVYTYTHKVVLCAVKNVSVIYANSEYDEGSMYSAPTSDQETTSFKVLLSGWKRCMVLLLPLIKSCNNYKKQIKGTKWKCKLTNKIRKVLVKIITSLFFFI